MNIEFLKARLREKGLKVTPKRLLILEAITKLKNHPTAEEILNYIRNRNIKIATATVYKGLDILVAKKALHRVETENNIVRYDAFPEPHHHLISAGSNLIRDYKNEEINEILTKYFETNKIRGFEIREIKLQIIGNFKNAKIDNHGKKIRKSE